MTTPVTAQGSAAQGMSPQQHGYTPGFPPPLGLEQYLGQPQQYAGFPQIQQIVQSLVSQLLPVAQQIILPQVVATAAQQIPVHLQQLVAQQVTWQLAQQGGWQQPYPGQMGWLQPQFAQQGQFGHSYPGSF